MKRSVLPLLLLVTPAYADATSGSVEFHFAGLRSSKGTVLCALHGTEKEWLKTPIAQTYGQVRDNKAVCVFNGLRPGSYGMAAFHDENGNGKLDSNWIGIPKEGLGASNNAKGRMSAPKWKDARFEYNGQPIVQQIALRYL